MTINISPDPRLQFFANSGSFLVGGKLYTYAAGTTTPLATYTDYTGTTPNTNPVILNSRGEASVWLGTSRYKFVLKDANDVEIWTQDNLIMSPGADGSGAYGTWPISITGNAATATTATYATTAGSASSVTGGYVQSITAGTNITLGGTATNPVINAASAGGTVTSVNASAGNGFSFSGGPITGSGTLALSVPAPGAPGNVLTSNGTSWSSQTFIGPTTFGGVGTYMFAIPQPGVFVSGGGTVSGVYGASIFPIPITSSGYAKLTTTYSTLYAGTWQSMGASAYFDGPLSDNNGVTLFLRIA